MADSGYSPATTSGSRAEPSMHGRRRKIGTENLLNVQCPFCRSVPREPCHVSLGVAFISTIPHVQRWQLANGYRVLMVHAFAD